MQKSVDYRKSKFSPEVIKRAFETLRNNAPIPKQTDIGRLFIYSADLDDETWDYDSEEEFFSDYARNPLRANYSRFGGDSYALRISFSRQRTIARVEAPTRAEIERVFQVLEAALPASAIKEPPSNEQNNAVFIGHGRNSAWRDLKDHLHEKHGFRVEAYEIGSRAGHAIRDVLEEMLSRSSLALLILTAEDEHADGTTHARENVIHELGLFQGRLGFHRAIVILEDGTSEFSNIHGLTQIRFSKGNIREVFGEVVAFVNREFRAMSDAP